MGNLKRKQDLSLDGIDLSFNFISLAYERMISSLLFDKGRPEDDHIRRAALLDCWTIVDCTRRLRVLLSSTVGLKRSCSLISFLSSTENVIELRHYFQHIDREIKRIESSGFPLWGCISWGRLRDEDAIEIHAYFPGTMAECKGIRIANPAGYEFHDEIDCVHLSVGDKRINISDIAKLSAEFRKKFQKATEIALRRDQREVANIISIDVELSLTEFSAIPSSTPSHNCSSAAPPPPDRSSAA